jgi:GNAT superfamily N-acetyltransferase
MPLMEIPSGLSWRPLNLGDAKSLTALITAEQMHDIGEQVIDEADIVSDWQRPSYDVEDSTIGLFDDDRMVAFAELSGGDRAEAAVHPDYRGRGLGTYLASWTREKARQRGLSVVGMPVAQGSPGDRLLEALGYRVRWTSWVLALPEGKSIEGGELAPGYSIRAATEDDHRAVWDEVEDAFLEWADRKRQSFEDFAAQVMERPGFEPWHLRVAVDANGDVVGVAFLVMSEDIAFVEKLAVRRDQRHLGLGRALLADVFAVARAHGATRSELSTDSRTGALDLYEKVGMEVTSVWVNRAIDLD